MICSYSVSKKGLVVVIFTINLYMTHTCTNTPLCIVFKEQNNCAILVIYCNILFIYLFWGDKRSCAMFREVQPCGIAFLEDDAGMSKYLLFCFGATWGQQKSKSVWRCLSVSSGVRCCNGKETNSKVYLVFYQPLSWLCKVTFFFKAVLFKTCLHVKTNKRNSSQCKRGHIEGFVLL